MNLDSMIQRAFARLDARVNTQVDQVVEDAKLAAAIRGDVRDDTDPWGPMGVKAKTIETYMRKGGYHGSEWRLRDIGLVVPGFLPSDGPLLDAIREHLHGPDKCPCCGWTLPKKEPEPGLRTYIGVDPAADYAGWTETLGGFADLGTFSQAPLAQTVADAVAKARDHEFVSLPVQLSKPLMVGTPVYWERENPKA